MTYMESDLRRQLVLVPLGKGCVIHWPVNVEANKTPKLGPLVAQISDGKQPEDSHATDGSAIVIAWCGRAEFGSIAVMSREGS